MGVKDSYLCNMYCINHLNTLWELKTDIYVICIAGIAGRNCGKVDLVLQATMKPDASDLNSGNVPLQQSKHAHKKLFCFCILLIINLSESAQGELLQC